MNPLFKAIMGVSFLMLVFIGGIVAERKANPALIVYVSQCEEDQVMIVLEDTNPDHGLTWDCVAVDDLVISAPKP